MTEREELELTLKSMDELTADLEELLSCRRRIRHQVWMKLNQARRLERKELQDDKRKS